MDILAVFFRLEFSMTMFLLEMVKVKNWPESVKGQDSGEHFHPNINRNKELNFWEAINEFCVTLSDFY
jgi:hypothetical protein